MNLRNAMHLAKASSAYSFVVAGIVVSVTHAPRGA